MQGRTSVPVYIEAGAKRVFACAVDWPGFCRSGKTEELALATLTAYAPRYAAVAARTACSLPDPFEPAVVASVRGGATTDFGAPECAVAGDSRPLGKPELARLIALMRAAWEALDETAAHTPVELRPGPRGGGRNRDRILEHVLAAESAYARKIGVRHAQPAVGDVTGIRDHRDAIVTGCRHAAEPGAATPWPVRYFVRRTSWHVLDHLWEMEDRNPRAS